MGKVPTTKLDLAHQSAVGGQRCRSKQDRAFSPIVLLGDLPLTYPYTAPAAGSNIPERHSANGGGRSEGRRPRAAGYVRGRAPDKMTGIRQDASSPAALAQRQKCPAEPGMRENAGQSSGCVSTIS